MWAGLLLCGLCAGIGNYLGGEYFGHATLYASVGGGIGGLLFANVSRYVDRRYFSEPN